MPSVFSRIVAVELQEHVTNLDFAYKFEDIVFILDLHLVPLF